MLALVLLMVFGLVGFAATPSQAAAESHMRPGVSQVSGEGIGLVVVGLPGNGQYPIFNRGVRGWLMQFPPRPPRPPRSPRFIPRALLQNGTLPANGVSRPLHCMTLAAYSVSHSSLERFGFSFTQSRRQS